MKLKDYKEKKMQDPEFVKAYEEIQPEMNVIRAMIEARTSQNLTQKELSERTGIAQTEISRLENGTRNPSIKLLQRLADSMGMVLNGHLLRRKLSLESRKSDGFDVLLKNAKKGITETSDKVKHFTHTPFFTPF